MNFGTQSLILGNSIIRLDNVDSTNNYAKLLLKQNKSLAEGTVIIAESQEQGRGQFGNSWVSEAGQNLTFSIVLYPKFLKAGEQFLLSQAVSLGIVDCLKNHVSVPVSIKWPNDILIEKQKVCGILMENNIMKDTLCECIVGIGLNANQTVFSKDVVNATSLKLISKKDFELNTLLHELLGCIAKYYLKLLHGQTDFIRKNYLKNLFQYNITADYRIKNETVSGSIVGVNEMGQLQLRAGNEIITLNNKEVEFLL